MRSLRSTTALLGPVLSALHSGENERPLLVEIDTDTRSASALRNAFSFRRPPRYTYGELNGTTATPGLPAAFKCRAGEPPEARLSYTSAPVASPPAARSGAQR